MAITINVRTPIIEMGICWPLLFVADTSNFASTLGIFNQTSSIPLSCIQIPLNSYPSKSMCLKESHHFSQIDIEYFQWIVSLEQVARAVDVQRARGESHFEDFASNS